MTQPISDQDTASTLDDATVSILAAHDLPPGSRRRLRALIGELYDHVLVLAYRIDNRLPLTAMPLMECTQCRALIRMNPMTITEHASTHGRS